MTASHQKKNRESLEALQRKARCTVNFVIHNMYHHASAKRKGLPACVRMHGRDKKNLEKFRKPVHRSIVDEVHRSSGYVQNPRDTGAKAACWFADIFELLQDLRCCRVTKSKHVLVPAGKQPGIRKGRRGSARESGSEHTKSLSPGSNELYMIDVPVNISQISNAFCTPSPESCTALCRNCSPTSYYVESE